MTINSLKPFEQLIPLDISREQDPREPESYHYLKPGEQLEIDFTSEGIGAADLNEEKYRLRLIGEVDLHYIWRSEGSFPFLYRQVDDALASDVTHRSPYSLRLRSDGENYPRQAYYKVTFPDGADAVQGQAWSLGCWCKKADIACSEGGRLLLAAEVFHRTEGRHFADIGGRPDEVHTIDLGEGSRDWEERRIDFTLTGEPGSILVYVTGERYTGTAWIEAPYLLQPGAGYSLLPPLAPSNPYMRETNWLGLHLSRKEWPAFDIRLNGIPVVQGELFQRIFVWPENEADIPANAIREGANKLTIKLTSDYREALPYKLKNAELIRMPNDDVVIIACPAVVSAHETFTMLVSTKRDRQEVSVSCGGGGVAAAQANMIFEKAGLNVIRLEAGEAGQGCELFVTSGACRQTAFIERIVERPSDDVLTGTGDAVYINQNISDMEHFLSWYLHHQIGNSLTFRPAYRWSGSRMLVPEVWERLAQLLTRLELPYSLMIDGRELPGAGANPGCELMNGPCFMGAQAHEQDGSNNYWGPRPVAPENELFFDLWSRSRDSVGLYPVRTPLRTEQGVYCFLNPHGASDMREAADNFIDGISQIKRHATRHTGPSTLFRYFYQAGLEWLGAELMYGPMEIVLAALRGASRAYGKDNYGGHLAVQWSSLPHDNEERMRRYRLALYMSYMQGLSHINTEEGLWRLENGHAYFERFSEACLRHTEIQQAFYRFVQTHARRGRLHTPMAVLQGAYDGWASFTRTQQWMQHGEAWEFGRPEASWDLLNVFYPLSKADYLTVDGYYSGTPYGAVDILPVEAEADTLGHYKLAAFLGWNTADSEQAGKLAAFVENGGTLLLGWPHLFTCTSREDALGTDPQVLDNERIRALIGAELDGFEDAIWNGQSAAVGRLRLYEAVPTAEDAEGRPIVIEHRIGEGKVVFVNCRAYPSEESVQALYEELLVGLGRQMQAMERERGWLNGSDVVGFTAFDHEDGDASRRTIYMLHVNWWEQEAGPSTVRLLWGERDIPLGVDRDRPHMLTLSGQWGVWTRDNETDVISIAESDQGAVIKLQGMGSASVTLFNKQWDGENRRLRVTCAGREVEAEPYAMSDGGWNIDLQLEGPAVLELKPYSIVMEKTVG